MARKPRKQPADEQAAVERIARLDQAIGAGPHARGFNRHHHIEFVLRSLEDETALALHRKKK